jgi:hypothetical protein
MENIKDTMVNLPNGRLFFKPQKNCHYGFMFNYKNEQLKITFELELTFLGIKNTHYASYQTNRSSFYVNNQIPDLMVYEIAQTMSDAIYPIEFTINQDLECITIDNHEAIIARCDALVEKMILYYQSPVAQKIISNFEEDYANQEKLVKQIQNDLAHKILFFPLYKSYLSYKQKSTQFAFPINNKVLYFDLEHELEKNYNEDGFVVINCSSLENKKDASTFNATYYLHPHIHTVAMAKGAINYIENNELETFTFECFSLD